MRFVSAVHMLKSQLYVSELGFVFYLWYVLLLNLLLNISRYDVSLATFQMKIMLVCLENIEILYCTQS